MLFVLNMCIISKNMNIILFINQYTDSSYSLFDIEIKINYKIL
jgi:hypothetical protein